MLIRRWRWYEKLLMHPAWLDSWHPIRLLASDQNPKTPTDSPNLLIRCWSIWCGRTPRAHEATWRTFSIHEKFDCAFSVNTASSDWQIQGVGVLTFWRSVLLDLLDLTILSNGISWIASLTEWSSASSFFPGGYCPLHRIEYFPDCQWFNPDCRALMELYALCSLQCYREASSEL